MQLFEMIRWGNDLDDPMISGPNGLDTCFLVRALSIESAAILADAELRNTASAEIRAWTNCAYLLGDALGDDPSERVLRGPYLQSAYNHGWQQWLREDRDSDWQRQ